jgi:hypothetical protein
LARVHQELARARRQGQVPGGQHGKQQRSGNGDDIVEAGIAVAKPQEKNRRQQSHHEAHAAEAIDMDQRNYRPSDDPEGRARHDAYDRRIADAGQECHTIDAVAKGAEQRQLHEQEPADDRRLGRVRRAAQPQQDPENDPCK